LAIELLAQVSEQIQLFIFFSYSLLLSQNFSFK
jgi:hypothetical protein